MQISYRTEVYRISIDFIIVDDNNTKWCVYKEKGLYMRVSINTNVYLYIYIYIYIHTCNIYDDQLRTYSYYCILKK